jgi:hypothetical protein
MVGIYIDTTSRTQVFDLMGYSIKANLAVPMFAPIGGAAAGISASNKRAVTAGGIIFAIGPDEFILVGKDFTLSFTPLKTDAQKPKIDIEYMDEGSFVNGKWLPTRRLNGDEGTGGGDYGFGFSKGYTASVKFQSSPTGNYNILKFKLYKY